MPDREISTEELEKVLMDPSTPAEDFREALMRIKQIRTVRK